jgi:uncharacterized protein YecT (DUF1311 family)
MRTQALVCAVALALAAVGAPALAAPAKDPVEARYTPGYQRCLDAPEGQSTYGMIECAGAELKIQDARLNAAYRKAVTGLNPRQKAKLLAAQRAWITFRDAECASFEDEDWGTLSRINAADCVLTMTVKRTIDLEAYPPGT